MDEFGNFDFLSYLASLDPAGYQTTAPVAQFAEPVSAAPDYGAISLSDDVYVDGIGSMSLGALTGQTQSFAPWQYEAKPTSGINPDDVTLINPGAGGGLMFVTNRGEQARVGSSGGYVPLDPNAQYRITDEKDGNRVLYTGTGEEGLKNVYALAQGLSADAGKKANWGVEMYDPATQSWSRVAEDNPGKGLGGVLDVVGDVALGALAGVATGGLALGPALAGAALGGGLKAAGANVTDIALPVIGAATGLGPVLGAGLGSVGSSVAQGRPLEDALLRGAITAGTAGLLDVSGLAGNIGGALGDVTRELGIQAGPALIPGVTGGVGGAVGGAVPAAVGGEIVVPGIVSGIPAAISSGVGAGIASALPIVPSPAFTPAPTPEPEIVVKADRAQNAIDQVNAGATLGDLVNAGFTDAEINAAIDASQAQQDIVVEATPQPTTPPLIPISTPTPTPTPEPEIVVEARPTPPEVDQTPIAVPIEGPIAQPLTPEQIAEQVPEADPDQKSLIDQIIEAYRLYALGSNLLGGGGNGGGGLLPYTSTLGPAPTLGRGTFQPFTGDYEKYGFGPEWNFFSPQAAPAPAAPTNIFANIPQLPYTPLL